MKGIIKNQVSYCAQLIVKYVERVLIRWLTCYRLEWDNFRVYSNRHKHYMKEAVAEGMVVAEEEVLEQNMMKERNLLKLMFSIKKFVHKE